MLADQIMYHHSGNLLARFRDKTQFLLVWFELCVMKKKTEQKNEKKMNNNNKKSNYQSKVPFKTKPR